MRRTVHVLALTILSLSVSSSSSAAVIHLGNVNGDDSLSSVNDEIADYNFLNGTSFDLMTAQSASGDLTVPEPATLALLGLGLLGAGMVCRRRNGLG